MKPEYWPRATLAERLNYVCVALFVILAFGLGGSARADAMSQPVVYLGAVALIVGTIAQRGTGKPEQSRTPLLCLTGLMIVIALQLVPLPPTVWRSLPGRQGFVAGLDLIGMGESWRPLSLTPDATLNSLVAMLPPLAVLMSDRLLARLRVGLLPVILGCCCVSAILAVLQVTGAAPSLYQITSPGHAAVGLFANRNHQAAMLACSVPLLAAWSAGSRTRPGSISVRTWLGWAAIAVVVPLLLVTGSRAGLIFGVFGLAASVVLARPDRALRRLKGARSVVLGVILAIAAIVPVALAVVLSRDEALKRLVAGNAGDRRIEWAGIFRRMAWDYFPAGSGFGSFESVFRAYEPFEGLTDTYLNNAHNDLVEIVIEGGALALVPLAAFITWYAIRTWHVWRDRDGSSVRAQAASVVLAILLLWSFVDYPLRTPALAVLAAVACLVLRVDAPPTLPVNRRSGA